jgi:hypothetical protein
VVGLAVMVGFDRERVFYPTVLIVIASYYVLFASWKRLGEHSYWKSW